MELTSILSFLLASIALTFMPGPDNIYVLSESITRGAKVGILISVGLISGIIIHTALAATGISIILKESELAFRIVQYLGAAYLFYLAYQATKETPLALAEEKGSAENFQLIRKGFLMNVLNPKVSLFFLALLPQFITPDGWPVPQQMMVLGGIFMIQGIIIFFLIAVLAGRLSRLIESPSFWSTMKWAKVVVLITLGISLLLASQ